MAEFDFEDLIKDIAKNKKLLSEKRFSKQEKNENPKDVYLGVCEIIASYYEPYGFKYSQSQQRLTFKKKGSEFAFRISFGSSHHNVADQYVEVTVYANVISSKFKKWQTETEFGNLDHGRFSEYIAGGQIGNLQEETTWLKWNVADTQTRDREIEDIIDHINKYAISFFQSYDALPELISNIERKGECIGMSDVVSLAKFLMYVSSKDSIEKTFFQFLNRRQMWDKYYLALSKLDNNEKINNDTYWNKIALLSKQLGLNLEETN